MATKNRRISLRAPDGKIMVPGFYDDVVDLTDEDRRQIAAVPFDERSYFTGLGVKGDQFNQLSQRPISSSSRAFTWSHSLSMML
jgi:hypothetical protein